MKCVMKVKTEKEKEEKKTWDDKWFGRKLKGNKGEKDQGK